MRFATEIDITNPEAGPAQQRVEVTQRLGGDVLEDEQLAHAPLSQAPLRFITVRLGPFWRHRAGHALRRCYAELREIPASAQQI